MNPVNGPVTSLARPESEPFRRSRYGSRRQNYAERQRHPPGKLADAELHFIDGELDGLKLIGFSIWERRGGGGRNVTFPARQYAVNGERRSFALLRPIADVRSQEKIRELVLQAFDEYDERSAMASSS
jgi:hypothetical protein